MSPIDFREIENIGILPSICDYNSFISSIEECKLCKRHKECSSPIIPDGDINSFVAFHSRDPAFHDDLNHTLFAYDSSLGKVFQTYLDLLKVARYDIYISCSVFCAGKDRRVIKHEEQLSCLIHKQRELYLLDSCKIHFLLGNNAYNLFLGLRAAPVIKDLGIVWIYNDIWFIPLPHPGQFMRDPKVRSTVQDFLPILRPFLKEKYIKHKGL